MNHLYLLCSQRGTYVGSRVVSKEKTTTQILEERGLQLKEGKQLPKDLFLAENLENYLKKLYENWNIPEKKDGTCAVCLAA